MSRIISISVCAALLAASGCKTADSAVNGVKSAGSAVASGANSVASAVPSLVNVNLSNVLNDLALDLKVDKANIPINAQIPISLAANVCGVSINVLSFGAGGGSSEGCTANSISPELKQYIQQQLAANGSVGGGSQTTAPATTTGTTSAAGTISTTPTMPTTQPSAATNTTPQ